jgi:hypothetical protein
MAKAEKLNEKEMRFKMTRSYGFSNSNFDDDLPSTITTPLSSSSVPVPNNNNFSNLNSAPAIVWRLIPIDLPDHISRPEIKSLEREIQTEREKSTLQCFFLKEFLPDTAGEPSPHDNDSNSLDQTIKTKIIPLEEIGHNNMMDTNTNLEDQALADSLTRYNSNVNNHHNNQPSNLISQELKTDIPFVNNIHKNPVEEKFYNPKSAHLLPSPTSINPPAQFFPQPSTNQNHQETLTNGDNVLNILNLGTSLLRSDQEAEDLKKILEKILKKPSSQTSEILESSKDVDHRDLTTTTSMPTSAPPKKTLLSAPPPSQPTLVENNNSSSNNEYRRPNSRWNNVDDNNTYNNNNYNRNVFTNNFKRGIGNRPGGPPSSSNSTSNTGYRSNSYNSNNNSKTDYNRNYNNSNSNNGYNRNSYTNKNNNNTGGSHNKGGNYNHNRSYSSGGARDNDRTDNDKTTFKATTTTPTTVTSNTNISSSGKWI